MITITKIPLRPNYFTIALLSEWLRLSKEAAAFVVNNNALPLYSEIECEEPAVRELRAQGFVLEWDKQSWTKQDWETYTNSNCRWCLIRHVHPCDNPFHKPTVKKEKK